MNTISIDTLNVAGFKSYKRRQEYYELYKIHDYDIIAIQETSSDDDETVRKAMIEWPGQSYWCKGLKKNIGVVILLRERLHIKVTKEMMKEE